MIRIKRKGVCDLNDGALNYYLARSNVNVEAFDNTLPLYECLHQAKKCQSQTKGCGHGCKGQRERL
jgi:hypothetical protein